MNAGSVCQEAAEYIIDNDVAVTFAFMSGGAAAKWTLSGDVVVDPRHYGVDVGNGIYLHPDPSNPKVLGAIVHEVKHLQQGWMLAISVEGEVGGWRAEYEARRELGSPIRSTHWTNVAMTPASPSNQELEFAQSEMMAYVNNDWRYLAWLLPLRPSYWELVVSLTTQQQTMPMSTQYVVHSPLNRDIR
jgi:hypothetical protein